MLNSELIAKEVLATQDPYLGCSWGDAHVTAEVGKSSDGTWNMHVTLPYAAEGMLATWEQDILDRIRRQQPDFRGQLSLATEWPDNSTSGVAPIQGVRHIIAVGSGKGGVGKSTTAVNLALALLAEGARVGILDADIYGPSIPTLLGTAGQKPLSHDGKRLEPIEAWGLQTMSLGNLVDDREAVIWRGPMASGALQQLLNDTAWHDLDVLVLDLPPGTGDIQLTMAQRIPVTGALVVTTPQDLALADARKAIAMFNKVQVPVLGVCENMSIHICSRCGHEEAIFGKDGGERLAQESGVPVLGRLPLTITIRQASDEGKPLVPSQPEGPETRLYRELARAVGARLASSRQSAGPGVKIVDD
jgi:ATP-binding protein involved in chromosome partitioning